MRFALFIGRAYRKPETIVPTPQEENMKKDVKKLLAGLGVAGLISAGGITVPGAHASGSGSG